jgi:hypothetical protein
VPTCGVVCAMLNDAAASVITVPIRSFMSLFQV